MIRIPEDISLVSYDSINYMDLMMTRPTSASFDMAAIGEKVGQLILNRTKTPKRQIGNTFSTHDYTG